ncbi:hypothetical protein [Sphingomonas sp.]|jgi:hypothetical protein|nr:hypothetical protein [Sphingomonas sp.]HEU0043673.1 hypothetical protein [Sphingomonas sp.]
MNSARVALRLVPALYGMGLGAFLLFLAMSYLAPEATSRLR